ncbi:MAG: hypothetical protein ACFFD5_11415 [Candidatus Thorarchaeota archaeon]
MPDCLKCGLSLTDDEFENFEGYCSSCNEKEDKDITYKSFYILLLGIFGLISIITTAFQIIWTLILNFDIISSVLLYLIPPSIFLILSMILSTYCFKRLKRL